MSTPGIIVTLSAAFLGSTLAALSIAALKRAGWLREDAVWLEVEYKRAPGDILRYLQPGTSVANMRKRFGPPVAESNQTFKYRYKNLYVEVESSNGTTIDSVKLVLPTVFRTDLFEIHPIHNVPCPEGDFVLGEMRLGDVAKDGDHLVRNTSSKSGSVAVTKYYGNPGYYQTYVFGVFNGPSAPYNGPHSKTSILDDPRSMVVNYVEITKERRSKEAAYFDWYTFRKISR